MEVKTLLKDGLLYICEDLGIKAEERMDRSQILELTFRKDREEDIEYVLKAFKRMEE